MINDKILEQRAIRLKQIKSHQKIHNGKYYLVFTVYPEKFCISYQYVLQVIKFQEIYYVPLLPEFVTGVIFWSGKIIPVINLKSYFNFKNPGLVSSDKLIILSYDGLTFALLADGVNGVYKFSDSELNYHTDTTLPNEIKGHFMREILLLDTEVLKNKLMEISY